MPTDTFTVDLPSSPPEFDGETYVPTRDRGRLGAQLERVLIVLSRGLPMTLAEISAETGDPEASCSARLRDLRKERFGGHVIERTYVANGLYRYQLIS